MKQRTRAARLILTMVLALALAAPAEAQRMKHSAPRPQGGSRGKSAGGHSINGGAQRSPNRPASQPATSNRGGSSVGSGGSGTRNEKIDGSKKANVGNKTNTGNRTNSGNKVNVDKSRGDVNINIDNSTNISRNTVVRSSPRVYARPPYVYGGRSYYCHSAYFYHPYHPYYWGPVWHPWGFFVATLAATAIVVTVANQQYHYDQGV